MPLLGIGVAFANSGIHTAISKYVAGASATGSLEKAKRYLYTGLAMSLGLGLTFAIPCLLFANEIATRFFHEPSIANLLCVLALSVPLECIHGCVNGYYYGLQKAAIPSAGQCIEQFARVGSVFGMYYILQQSGLPFTKMHAMLGLLIGEIIATFYYLTALSLNTTKKKLCFSSFKITAKDLFQMAYPVTGTRLSLNFINSFENIMIPVRLGSFGLTNAQALSIYGIYSGMAIPMIFFPTVVANSIAVMLLPSISKAKEEGRDQYIHHTIVVSFFLCMLLGFLFAFFFFYFGVFIGEKIFHNQVAGIYIKTLAWLCPFIFLGITMNSILNGLGNTKDTFVISISGALIRICFIMFGIHRYGFRAFLLGVLISQVISSFAAYSRLMCLCQNITLPNRKAQKRPVPMD